MKFNLSVEYYFDARFAIPYECGRYELVDGQPAPHRLNIDCGAPVTSHITPTSLMFDIVMRLREADIPHIGYASQGHTHFEFRFLNERDSMMAKLMLSGQADVESV